ncbi:MULTISPECIES: AAA family ATPase [unclassified Streptomyces]|uniref:AAA family ATPase n=1 Tax=unclassified Streptomyces TaxID=2593676 RepID=UPI00380FC048
MSDQAPEPGERPVLRPQFFLDVPGSSLVTTDVLLQVQDTIVETIEARAMSLIYGDAGLGKTFATRAALRQVAPDLLLSLEFARSRPGPKDLREELFVQMRLPGKMPGTATPLYRLLLSALPRRPYVIVCDESQQYSRQCFEFIRNAWDNTRTNRPAVIFIGGREANDTLQSDPALASRICTRTEVLAMSEDEALSVVPDTHPVWATVDTALLQHIDRVHADGSMREWAKVTHHVLKGLKHFKTDTVDRSVVDWALKQC